MSDKQRTTRTDVNFGAVACMSINRPFCGRPRRLRSAAIISVHRMRPAYLMSPTLSDHVQWTVGIRQMFSHRVVYLTTDAMPSDDGGRGPATGLPRGLPESAPARVLRRPGRRATTRLNARVKAFAGHVLSDDILTQINEAVADEADQLIADGVLPDRPDWGQQKSLWARARRGQSGRRSEKGTASGSVTCLPFGIRSPDQSLASRLPGDGW